MLAGSEAVGGSAECCHGTATSSRRPWNTGLIVGQKRPLLPRQVWSIRVRLEISASARNLALFNLAIDSGLRASDLVRLKIEDICSGALVRDRGTVTQLKHRSPRSVRDHGSDPAIGRPASRSPGIQRQWLPVPKQIAWSPAHLCPPVRTHCSPLDPQHRARRPRLRYSLAAQNQSRADLPEDR